MRVMVFVKATPNSEAGTMPSASTAVMPAPSGTAQAASDAAGAPPTE